MNSALFHPIGGKKEDYLSENPSVYLESEIAARSRTGLFRLYIFAVFLVGLFRSWTIPLVGQLPVSELILCAVLTHAVLWLILARALPVSFPAPRFLLFILAAQVVAFCSYVVSDLWRHSLPLDMIRGWLRMLFVLIDIVTLSMLFGLGRRAFVWLHIGVICSAFQCLFIPPLFDAYWKFGFGYPVTIAALLLFPRYFGLWGGALTCIGLGLLHSFLAFRSLGAICLVVGALNMFVALPTAFRKIGVVAGAVFVALTLPFLASNKFNDTTRTSNRSDVERSAMVQAAWEGFSESPLLGNGSWFSNSHVMDNFLLIRTQRAIEAGGGMHFKDNDFEGVAIHSQILTALAEGGIFGGAFFFVYLAGLVWALWYCVASSPWNWLIPLRIFLLITASWDLMMSPFSGTARVGIGVAVATILMLLQEKQDARLTHDRQQLGDPVVA